jgi:GH15 family glucan-1,4-alpha-glucosidase
MKVGRKGIQPRVKTFQVPVKERYKPILGYGVIGNTRTVALVGYDGSIDWCCMPNFDSPSIFAGLLDSRAGGRWQIVPKGRALSTQRYVEYTNILQTEFTREGSKVVLTDFMPSSLLNEVWAAPPEIHRVVECTEGSASMLMTLEPRPQYGRVTPDLKKSKHGVGMADKKDELALSSTVDVRVRGRGMAKSEFMLSEGERAVFVLSYGEYEPRNVENYQTSSQLLKTEAFWKYWVSNLRYRGKWSQAVLRSALALKLLVYSPTGALVAAPTASLPESIGGERNWDYRYSWIRDSATSLWAFYVLGDRSESEGYLHWLVNSNPSLDLDLRLMYTVDGHSHIAESVLNHLEGYRGSGPVRVGNAAVRQVQLDAYGYMLDALYFSSRHGMTVTEEMYHRFVKALARQICNRWRRKGNGIWEIRGRKRHYVYTRAWCYAGLARAVSVAKTTGHRNDAEEWLRTMKAIKDEVLRKGWDEKKRTFVMSYESKDLDAACLMLPLNGFISAKDKRMTSTMEAIAEGLGEGPLLYRYRIDDGLEGKEGAFVLCSFWMVACLAKAGKVGAAERMFEKLLGYANHLGLYSEEIDPSTGQGLGNFPQAFSHMGLIMAAHELEKAVRKTASDDS